MTERAIAAAAGGRIYLTSTQPSVPAVAPSVIEIDQAFVIVALVADGETLIACTDDGVIHRVDFDALPIANPGQVHVAPIADEGASVVDLAADGDNVYYALGTQLHRIDLAGDAAHGGHGEAVR